MSTFKAGDIFYTQANGQYYPHKLLLIDENDIWHVLSYQAVDQPPTLTDHLNIFIYHSPFDAAAFPDAILLGYQPVQSQDLIGYHEYLRQTRDPEYYIPIVTGYFNEALGLSDQQLHWEAIDAYTKAADLFPMLYEALDNRAFVKMDLGLWQEAIADFLLSLEVNPVSVLAEFSIGECYLRLGEYQLAKEQFEKALQIDPNDELSLQFLKEVNGLL